MEKMTNEEIIKRVKDKLSEKSEVIMEQQRQIQDYENKIRQLVEQAKLLQQQVQQQKQAAEEREGLIDGLAEILES